MNEIRITRQEYCKRPDYYIDLASTSKVIVIITDDRNKEVARVSYPKIENDFTHHDYMGTDNGPY